MIALSSLTDQENKNSVARGHDNCGNDPDPDATEAAASLCRLPRACVDAHSAKDHMVLGEEIVNEIQWDADRCNLDHED